MSRSGTVLPLHHAGGNGPPVVLIHGFGADRLSWLANQTELAKVASVYTVDLPGHGGKPLSGDASFGVLAEAVGRSIDAAGLESVHLVGHSLGAAIALMLAAERPDRVRSLALIAPAGLGGPVDPDFLATYPRLEDSERATALLQRLVSRPRLINRFMVAQVLEQLAVPGVRDGLAAVAGTLAGANGTLEAAVARVAQSDLPRLVIWGDADAIVPMEAERLTAFGGETLIVPGAAHMPHVEQARLVNERLVEWLAGPAATT